jgi:hypothetical protein
LRDVVLERAQLLIFLKQRILGVQDRKDIALLVGDFDLPASQVSAVQQALSKHFPASAEGFAIRHIEAGKLLAFDVAADVAIIFTYMEKEFHVEPLFVL